MPTKFMFNNTTGCIVPCNRNNKLRSNNSNNQVIKINRNLFLNYLHKNIKSAIYNKVYGQIIKRDIEIQLKMNKDGSFTLHLKTHDINLRDIPKSLLKMFETELKKFIENYRENGKLKYKGRLNHNITHKDGSYIITLESELHNCKTGDRACKAIRLKIDEAERKAIIAKAEETNTDLDLELPLEQEQELDQELDQELATPAMLELPLDQELPPEPMENRL